MFDENPKKNYQMPQMEVILYLEDIITASSGGGSGIPGGVQGDENWGEWD